MTSSAMLSKLLAALLLLLTRQLAPAAGQCNTCVEANSMACYSATQMQSCTNNVPSATPTDCPAGYVCVSSEVGVMCQVESTTMTVACSGCTTCDASLTFACTGTNTFALCLNSNTPSTVTGTCGTGTVCNIDNPFVCGSTADGLVPTCSYADDVTTTTTTTTTTTVSSVSTSTSTTTAAPITAASYCQALQQSGRFPYGTDPSTTCKQYIYCYQLSGSWLGDLYTCPGQLYFDSTLQHCTATLPASCTTAVVSLRLNGLELL